MKALFANTGVVAVYFLALGMISLLSRGCFQGLLKAHGALALLVVETCIAIALLTPIAMYQMTRPKRGRLATVTKLSAREWGYLAAVGVFGIATGLVSSQFLRYNSVSTLVALDLGVGVIVSLVGARYLDGETISWSRWTGAALVVAGAYMLS